MKKKWWQVLAMTTALGVTPVFATPTEAAFSDVKSTNSHKPAIDALAQRGIVSGFEDGTYRPSATITRGQVAKVLAKVMDLDTTNVDNPNFSDVPVGHAYYKEIAALQNAQIISGFTDGTYRSGRGLTREQMARMLVNGFGLTYNDSPLPFSDVVMGSEAHYLVGSLYEYGITEGRTRDTFDLASTVTRGQLASFVHRTEQALAKRETIKLAPKDFYVDFLDAYTYELDEPMITLQQIGDTIVIEALRPGTTTLFLDGYRLSDDYFEYAFSQKYTVTITDVNGDLQMELTEDDSLTPGSTLFSVQDIGFVPENVTITTLAGEPLNEKMYKLQYHATEEVYELLMFDVGQYIATFTSADGKTQRAGVVSEFGEAELIIFDSMERDNVTIPYSQLGFKPVKVEYEQFTGVMFKEPVVTSDIGEQAFTIRHAIVGDAMFGFKLTGENGQVMYIQGASYQTAGITTIEYTVVSEEDMESGIF